ncbi:hypothetical protein JTE90_002622 [Oedothorax gibbosus]|uniref:Uncharacterized protein n=1 Tax=Oedothorax gibbosus TaxID=931172 RepID=A0AAV6UEG2_9ARAC|nr:hypothetical protein JTE90_002622 [Oedothorax gibbosus]
MDTSENFCKDSFWDLNQTWYSQVPVLTSCFEDIIFTSGICFLYSLIIFISLFLIPRPATSNPLPWTWLNITKSVICICLWVLSVVWCGAVFHTKYKGERMPSSTLMTSIARVMCFSLVGIANFQHRICRVTTSTVLSTFWLVFSFASIVLYRSSILTYFTLKSEPATGIIFALNMIFYPIIFIQLFLSVLVDKKKFNTLQEDNLIKTEVSFLTHITFLWFMKTILKGRKTLLKISDFSYLSVSLTASGIYATFSKHFKYYLKPHQEKNPSLGFTLVKAFWPYITCIIVLELMFLICVMLPPLILDRIIDFSSNDLYSWRGYLYVGLIFVVDCSGKIIVNNLVYYQGSTSLQFQVALMGTLFRKNLQVATSVRKDFPSGNLMNLLSVDIQRIHWLTVQAATLVSAPLKIVIIVFIMWQYLGPSTLAGVGIMVFLLPISFYLTRVGEGYTDQQMTSKDLRLKHMNEILNGIKILKLYAWEIPFGTKVSEARKEEIKWIRYYLFCYVVTAFVYFCAPFMVSLASFATYLLTDRRNILDPTRAFVTLALTDQLRYALFGLPDTISELVQCNVSLGRLRKFFIAENKDESMIGNNPEKGEVLTMKEASFSWSTDNGECTLKNINLSVPKGKLIAVIGPVGSGKSSLISAILGEMSKESGSIDMRGTIAYVPQQPWVLNRTLKRNILLERHMNEDKYNKIVEVCCLKPDLDILPAGDLTEIGEKGVNLSGGQKLRVNLAQAVYQDKEIYLLDDPLSAVDVHVRKSLFTDVIGNTGLLRNKTRVLVTHDVSVLHHVDLIVSMKVGEIDEIGTYGDLLSRKGVFRSFVGEHSNAKMLEDPKPKYNRTLSRLISTNSTSSKNSHEYENEELHFWGEFGMEPTKGPNHRLTDDERIEVGGVHRHIYINYIKQGGVVLFLCAAIWYAAFKSFEAGANVWLTKWSTDAVENSTQRTSETIYRLSVYGTFGFVQVICVVFGSFLLVYAATKASEFYHNDMLDSVLKSPMSFFDSTPTGRILNRFTTDLDTLDLVMFYRMDGWLHGLFSMIASFIVIGISTPLFFAFLLPLAVAYYIIQKLHLTTFRQIKRLESNARSPVYSLFMESIQGVSSILAYGVQKEFILNFEKKLDDCFVCFYNSWVCKRWFTFFLDLLSSLIILVATSLAIHNRESLSPAVVGLIISYSFSVTDAMEWFVEYSSELEDKSISIERVEEYCHLKPEASWDLSCDGLEDNWPQNGNIVFDGYSTKYREDLDLVLKEIRLSVNASEKVGIIGRTGAGKSSITLALFRIIEPVSGTIVIDNIDITKIGLHNLREKLTIIPQDPVLFTGSLRMNIDPRNAYTDDEIWTSLEKSHLKGFASGLAEGLNFQLEEGGSNLSAGQRQLVCLSRALLKNSKILVLDEATASVDMDTDNLIQKTIRTAFADNTVITIAHRIHTVMDYDKIVVLERGNIVEVGNPKELLKDSNSKFYEMNKEAGLI